MSTDPGTSSPKSAVVSHFRVRDRHYESRLVDCGKANCSRCGGTGPRRPSHGPYWYLCYTHNARWYRQYLGKDVDTSRYITDQGNLDTGALMAKRSGRRMQPAEKGHEAPGQLEFDRRGGPLQPAEKSHEAPGQLELDPPGGPAGPENPGDPQLLLPHTLDPHDPGPVPQRSP